MSRVSRATFSSSNARTFVMGIVLVLLLGGCHGGSMPSEPPSATSTTTASPAASAPVASVSATPSSSGGYKPADAKGKAQNVPVPVMPELAKENSKAGLEAFIRYWYATYSYATETGDLEPWTASTDATTESGAAYKRAVELNYTSGRWVAGGRITTPVVEVLWKDGADPQSAKAQVVQEQIQYFDADGTPGQEATPAYNTAEAVIASYQHGLWQVVDSGLIVG